VSSTDFDPTYLDGAQQRLTATLRALGDAEEELHRPSRLPEWSRAHVLVHIARNAEGLENLLLAARTGAALRMYSSPSTRAADIAAGAGRPVEVIVADVVESSFRFLVEVQDLPIEAWATTVSFNSGAPDPPNISALRVAELRLEEVEVHHVDLDLGYGFSDTPADLADRLIDNFATRRAVQGVPVNIELEEDPLAIRRGVRGAPTVRGKRADVLSWLAGRSLRDLSADTPDGAPPALPTFA
jgi:maleylpyruvate isomerase